LLSDLDEQREFVFHAQDVGTNADFGRCPMIKFPHFGIWLPLGGSHIPKWQKKGEGRRGSVPRAALVAYFIVYLLNYLLTSVDRVVS
jgi:hypothetical protein